MEDAPARQGQQPAAAAPTNVPRATSTAPTTATATPSGARPVLPSLPLLSLLPPPPHRLRPAVKAPAAAPLTATASKPAARAASPTAHLTAGVPQAAPASEMPTKSKQHQPQQPPQQHPLQQQQPQQSQRLKQQRQQQQQKQQQQQQQQQQQPTGHTTGAEVVDTEEPRPKRPRKEQPGGSSGGGVAAPAASAHKTVSRAGAKSKGGTGRTTVAPDSQAAPFPVNDEAAEEEAYNGHTRGGPPGRLQTPRFEPERREPGGAMPAPRHQQGRQAGAREAVAAGGAQPPSSGPVPARVDGRSAAATEGGGALHLPTTGMSSVQIDRRLAVQEGQLELQRQQHAAQMGAYSGAYGNGSSGGGRGGHGGGASRGRRGGRGGRGGRGAPNDTPRLAGVLTITARIKELGKEFTLGKLRGEGDQADEAAGAWFRPDDAYLQAMLFQDEALQVLYEECGADEDEVQEFLEYHKAGKFELHASGGVQQLLFQLRGSRKQATAAFKRALGVRLVAPVVSLHHAHTSQQALAPDADAAIGLALDALQDVCTAADGDFPARDSGGRFGGAPAFLFAAAVVFDPEASHHFESDDVCATAQVSLCPHQAVLADLWTKQLVMEPGTGGPGQGRQFSGPINRTGHSELQQRQVQHWSSAWCAAAQDGSLSPHIKLLPEVAQVLHRGWWRGGPQRR